MRAVNRMRVRRAARQISADFGRHGVPRAVRPPRRGSVLAGVLLCLAAAMAIAVALLNNLRFDRDFARQYSDSVQVRWLAESGVQRAAARIAADADFQGETWTVAAEPFGGERPASVVVSVAAAENPGERKVTVTANIGDSEIHRKRFTRHVTMRRQRLEE